MRKILPIFLCVVLLLSVAVSAAACKPDATPTDELVVYNWADYIYDYKDDFYAYYKALTGRNIKVTYVTFDTNETMLAKIMQGDAKVDVICPSEYAIQKLLEKDLLLPLNYFDEDKYVADMQVDSAKYVHNGGNVDRNVLGKIDEAFGAVSVAGQDGTRKMSDYMVPYMYGTLGILYNKYAFIDLGIYDYDIMNKANWGILFNDDGEGNLLSSGLTGNILMKDSIRDSYAATLFYLKESGKLDGLTSTDESSSYYGKAYSELSVGEFINAVDDQLLSLCQQALTQQKKQLFGYEVDFGKDDLLKGNAMVDLAWSGDAMYAVEESWDDALCAACSEERGERVYGEEKRDEDGSKYYVCKHCQEECGDYELSYYVPHSAGNIWFDGWAIPKNTYNPEHLNAIKIFINFLNSPRVAAENMMEIGYSSAVDPEAVRQDADARETLSRVYLVDCGYWDKKDENGKDVTEFDYGSWEEFEEYFFDSRDVMDNSNWRYPFVLSDDATRALETLGVMRDFGANNKAVVTMWNYARSTGENALPLLGWTALALFVAVGIIVLCEYIKRLHNSKVKIASAAVGGTLDSSDE